MIIEPSHFEYLVIQHGKVSDHRHDSAKWQAAYEASLADIFASIAPVLPRECSAVLDIGSGLGGIDVLVAKHYSPQPSVYLLDGLDDEPVVKNSFTTFSNSSVAVDFQQKNGVKTIAYTDSVPAVKFDLIHSYFSYGFHVHPGNYLDDIKKACHKNTVLIFDVRRSKKEWLREFAYAWSKQPKILFAAEKYVRVAFNV